MVAGLIKGFESMEEQITGTPQDGQEDSTGMDIALPSVEGAHALSLQPANAPGGCHRAREVWQQHKSMDLIGWPLLSLHSNGCRYPIGVNADGLHLFCAKPIERHQGKPSSYCAGHNLIAYAKTGAASQPKPAKVFDWGDAKAVEKRKGWGPSKGELFGQPQRGAQTAVDAVSG